MQVIERTIYKYEELPTEKAKEKAREWYRDLIFQDECDWECVEEDAIRVAGILGIEFKGRPYKTVGGDTRYEPCLWFTLAYCQGDGASFDGTYRYAKGCAKEIRNYAPVDKKLHAMADQLVEIQKPFFYKLTARISANHHNLSVDVEHADDRQRDVFGTEKDLRDVFRDFCRWYYDQVRTLYEYLCSDEAVIESIEANEYDFDEDGRRRCI